MDLEPCEHDWVYANYMLPSNPPLRPKICRKCGTEEMERDAPYTTDYNVLKRLWEHKPKRGPE